MPIRAKRPCGQPGCRALVDSGRCGKHIVARDRPRDRPSSCRRGYGYRWQRASRVFLAEHPLCVDCAAEGREVGATQVDHIVPHKGDGELFWDQGNWQPLCAMHHSRKTAVWDGGFGRPVRSGSDG